MLHAKPLLNEALNTDCPTHSGRMASGWQSLKGGQRCDMIASLLKDIASLLIRSYCTAL